MSPSDAIKARLRTLWPMLLGFAAGQLLDVGAPVVEWIDGTFGVRLTQPLVEGAVGLILGWAIYEAGRWLEKRAGEGRWSRLARGAGRALLSFGVATGLLPTLIQCGCAALSSPSGRTLCRRGFLRCPARSAR